MTAPAVLPPQILPIPTPRRPEPDPARRPVVHAPAGPAVSYQRVLHQLVRRELRLLAELASWAPADEKGRISALSAHADLTGRVLLHHQSVERDLLWPALMRAVPGDRKAGTAGLVAGWTDRCTRLGRLLRDVHTCARQWEVVATPAARDAFARACRRLADDVDAHTAEEERSLLPLVAGYLPPEAWTAITREADCRLSARERRLVLGLALEDASAADRGRVLDGLPRPTRLAWQLSGRRRFVAAVVRLRGAPPAR